MKFVYFGYDFMLGGVRRLIEGGHTPVAFFTFECDNVFNFNQETLSLAKSLNIPTFTTPPQTSQIEDCLAKGAECFIAAGYPFKIPPIDEKTAYAINLHPSLLPEGRGIMPTPFILLDHPEAAGYTIHKLTEKFDAGDILLQEPLLLRPRETVETLSSRIAMEGTEALAQIMTDLPAYWAKAKPQNEADALHFPLPDEQMRRLDWSLPVARIDAIARAFGRFGSIAEFEDRLWVVYHLDTWEEPHRHAPGTILHREHRTALIAALNGFVCLKDFHPAQLT